MRWTMPRAFLRPTISSLYAQMKIDLYTFSGGKGLQGPQCSGVLLAQGSDRSRLTQLSTMGRSGVPDP